MRFEIDPALIKRAKFPHELFMVNLAGFHLLGGPAGWITLDGPRGLLVPLVLSTLMMLYTLLRGRLAERSAPWFVMVHWKLALRRYLPLFIAYAVTGAILTVGWLVGSGAETATGRDLVFTIFTRFGVMPTFITVLVVFVIESQSIYQAVRGEVLERMVRRYPPPADLRPLENPAPEAPQG